MKQSGKSGISRFPKTRRTLPDEPPPPSSVTDGGEGEGEAAEVEEMSEVVGDCDSVVGGSGETNGVTGEDNYKVKQLMMVVMVV